jgi:hypothetical protein
VLVPVALLTHFTTEHGRYAPVPPLPVTISGVAELPASMEEGARDAIACGGCRFAVGLAIVNCNALDAPEELETVTGTGLEMVVSAGKIVALS